MWRASSGSWKSSNRLIMPSRNEQITANRVPAGAPTDCERERWVATISIRSPIPRARAVTRTGPEHSGGPAAAARRPRR